MPSFFTPSFSIASVHSPSMRCASRMPMSCTHTRPNGAMSRCMPCETVPDARAAPSREVPACGAAVLPSSCLPSFVMRRVYHAALTLRLELLELQGLDLHGVHVRAAVVALASDLADATRLVLHALTIALVLQ